MKVLAFFLLLIAAMVGIVSFVGSDRNSNPDRIAEANLASDRGVGSDQVTQSDMLSKETGGVAVVELFTSEGCSSCPPAEALLNELAARADSSGTPIYALAFHVDYWDRLGWKDPFSSSDYSDRQRTYARVMRKKSIYTPQMIVNGMTEFTGSDRKKAHHAIGQALQDVNTVEITLTLLSQTDSVLSLQYDLGDEIELSLLNVALVEKNLATDVPRGENAGRSLRHENVVRSFSSISADKRSGIIELPIPNGINLSESSIIGYIQDPRTMKIDGAVAIKIVS